MPKYDPFLKKLRMSDVNSNNKGGFANESALTTAYPVGQEGWYALNYDTDTMWVWDAGTVAWVDSGSESVDLSNVTNDAQLKIDSNLSDLDDVDTAVENLGLNKFQSAFTSANSTGFVWADNVLTITHGLTKSNLSVSLTDASGNQIDSYTGTETDSNTLSINFPVAQIPITGTWNVKIF